MRLLFLLLALLAPRAASADSEHTLDIGNLRGGVTLTPYLSAFEDPDGKTDLDQLLTRELDDDVKVSAQGEPSFGFTEETVWLQLDAANGSDETRTFLLDLAYPLLDHVTLYTVHADGRREQRVTGDALPFSQRDVPHPNFVFRLSLPAHGAASYYLRLQTSGVLKAPLTAWEPTAFLVSQQSENVMLWMFYGALTVLALYNFGVFLTLRRAEYLAYVFMATALGAIALTLNGHTSQYLLPNHPEWANRAAPVALGLLLMSISVFARMVLRQLPDCQRDARRMQWWLPPTVLLTGFSCVASPGLALRVMIAAAAVAATLGVIQLSGVARRKNPLARLYVLSWGALIIAFPVQILRYANLLPSSFATDWALHIGFALHGLITTLALASRINIMRDQLASNVTDLESALLRAEEASELARRATLAKDEFVATMSHELRTPLNAIINVPQGLLESFSELRTARCSACEALFVLEPKEQIDAQTACAECGATGLVLGTKTRFQGDPERTVHFLRRIERSGRHLLQMINGVLDFSKLEAGHLSLQLMDVELGSLLRDAVDEIGDPAAKKRLQVTLIVAERALPNAIDPTRVKQIVLNLLSNAVKFSEEGGTITVRWQALPTADVIAVQDQGIGISASDHERVFQRFEQVHKGDTRKYGGTGLGLPISRSLARMHGGDITLESKPGAGSRFTLTLPRQPLTQQLSTDSNAAE